MSISKIDLILDDLKGNHVLLAHSGGVDSCVLAEIFINKKINFSVAHCNFKLRDKESDEDLKFVKNWCIENNTPFYFKVFDVKGYIIVNKKSIQEAARDLRYEWFNSLMVDLEIDILATAHHLNDQLETFLINSIGLNMLASRALIKSSRSHSDQIPGGGPPALFIKISGESQA